MAIKYLNGRKFDPQTYDMLIETQRLFGKKLRIVQGSYNRGRYSAGTHSGPGAVDISVSHLSKSDREKLTSIMRRVGFAAWLRTPADGFSPHIHAITNGLKGLPGIAYRQTVSYKNGRNGLRSNLKDRQAYLKVPYRTWAQYKKIKAANASSIKALPKSTVRVKQVTRGQRNASVKRFQGHLRKYLWANGINPNRYNKAGATGYYGYETAAMAKAAHQLLARKTGNKNWNLANINSPSKSLLLRIGLRGI